MQGSFIGQRLSTLPAWAASDEGRMVYAEDVDKYYYGDNAEWVEMIGDVSSLDGDHIDIDWEPSYYTPNSSIAEADDVDDLAAHLKGIDTTLATLGASAAGGGSVDYTLYDEQTVDPTTAANQMAFLAKESTVGSTTMPYFRPESDGTTIRLLIGDASSKFWMYRNGTSPGFIIDATVTDKVLSFKGGSDAYNVNGGNIAGTWTQPTHTHTGPSHTHSGPSHSHTYTTVIAHTHTLTVPVAGVDTFGGPGNWSSGSATTSSTGSASGTTAADGTGTTGAGGTGATGADGTAATYRPYAAVGTLQYPDI